MEYLYFSLTFILCCACICGTFLFCSRVMYIQKVEKLDPINVVKTQKRVTALKRIKQDELLERMLENG